MRRIEEVENELDMAASILTEGKGKEVKDEDDKEKEDEEKEDILVEKSNTPILFVEDSIVWNLHNYKQKRCKEGSTEDM